MAARSSTPFPPLQNDLILRAAKGEKTEKVPVWVMRQAGRYLPEYKEAKGQKKFFETCREAELVSELTIQPIKRFPVDAAIIFSDILVIPIALGMKVANDPGEGPVFAEPILKAEDVDKLNPNFNITTELGYIYEAINLTRHNLEGKVPLFGFCGGPFTVMRFMVENVSAGPNVHRTRRFLVECPEAGDRLLRILKDAIVRHLVEQIAAGAQIVQVFDTYAGELGPSLFAKYELPRLKEIAMEVKIKLTERNLDHVPMIVFCKDVHFALEELSQAGYDVVGLDWTIQPQHARRLTESRVTLQGNMDPVMMFATKEEIRRAVKDMLKKFGTQRYIANLGHGVMKDTDPECLGEFIKAVHECSEDMNSLP